MFSSAKRAQLNLRKDAVRFAEADDDGSLSLSADEFIDLHRKAFGGAPRSGHAFGWQAAAAAASAPPFFFGFCRRSDTQ